MNNYSPQEWVSYTIDEVVNRYIDFRGRTPIKLGMVWGGGDIRALSANNVQMGKIDFDKECYFGSESLYERWMTKGDCSKGDIAFTTEAPLGNVAQIPDDKKYILSQRTILLKVCSDVASTDYIYHLLRSEPFQTELIRHSTGSTVVGIQQKKLARIKVTIPSVFVQRKIAKILSTVDNLIEKTQALIDKYQSIKQGMMHDLFTRGVDENGHLRPSYEEAPHLYKESELGWIPKEWEVKRLGNIGKFKNGLNKGKESFGFGAKFINISDVFPEHLDISALGRMDATPKELEDYKVSIGDILLDRSSVKLEGVGYPTIFKGANESVIFCGFIIRFQITESNVNPDFLFLQMRTPSFRQRVIRVATQSANVNINQEALSGVFSVSPSVEEQQRATNLIQSINRKIKIESTSLDKFLKLKSGLMQDLLTGKVRVKVDA